MLHYSGATPCKPLHRDTLDLPIEWQYPKTRARNPSTAPLTRASLYRPLKDLGGFLPSGVVTCRPVGILSFLGASCLSCGYPGWPSTVALESLRGRGPFCVFLKDVLPFWVVSCLSRGYPAFLVGNLPFLGGALPLPRWEFMDLP